MAKTENQIERDFFALVKDSSLGKAIRGKVLRRGQRADNAKTEDCIVKFLGGVDMQVQTGTVILNVYVPYVPNSTGKMCEDLTRIGELEDAAISFVKNCHDTDYDIETETTPQTYPQDEIEQSIIAIRIKFQRLNQE